jgi:hypothetical protein
VIRKDEEKGIIYFTKEMYAKFWSENLKGRDHLDDLDVDG